jgi:pimeloyl-ACP methyl ester carboxylesterase
LTRRQILFIQGGGAGAHDEWDGKLVESLSRQLGEEYEVRYPRMPDEDDPSYAGWSPTIRREMDDLNDDAVVIGHSVGGTILIHALAERPPNRKLSTIVLIGAPFVGVGGWPGDEFELPHDLGSKLPQGVPVHVFHGLQDQTAPPSHADLYASAIPQAQVHRLPGRDHQLDNDLSEVARSLQEETP